MQQCKLVFVAQGPQEVKNLAFQVDRMNMAAYYLTHSFVYLVSLEGW